MALEAAYDSGHFRIMNRTPPVLDMTPEGTFRTLPRPAGGPPLSFKLLVGAVLVAVVAGAVSVAALALWVMSMLLPVAILAGAAAWATLRFRRWQAQQRRDLYTP